MATLTPTLTLTSSDSGADTLSLSVTDSLSVAGDVIRKRIAIPTGGSNGVSIIGTAYNKCYVFVKNTDSSIVITLGPDNSSTADWREIGPGEFMFFNWDGTVELFANSDSGSPVLELMIFEATA